MGRFGIQFNEKKKIVETLRPHEYADHHLQESLPPKKQHVSPLPPLESSIARPSSRCPPPSIVDDEIEQQERINTEGWTIIVRFGEVMSQSPTYRDFKARNIKSWIRIRYILGKVAKVLKIYSIPWAEIRCALLRDLIPHHPNAPPCPSTLPTIHSLISNIDLVGPLLNQPGRRYVSDPDPRTNRRDPYPSKLASISTTENL
ncbi:hypothetical protein BC829DRAFT_257096 [Chytridium lagenaria]|nr:hypothetical protein BC829DRAFT_257096 [Chytridium lagenaria]